VTIGSYAFSAYQSVYSARYPGLSLSSILTPEGVAATPKMAGYCLFTQTDELHELANTLIGHYVSADPATTEPWATMLRENTPGPMPADVPLLVAQGEADTLVLPAATRQFVATQCAAGAHVTFDQYPNDTHGTIALAAMPAVSTFLAAALRGDPPASTC
jgi:dienelactone hydrolase